MNHAKTTLAGLATLAVPVIAWSQSDPARLDTPWLPVAGPASVPDGFRDWPFLGAPPTPNGLNHGAAGFPEFHHVHINPAALADESCAFCHTANATHDMVFTTFYPMLNRK